MRVWIDADACPGAVMDIVVRTANRLSIETVFVANKQLRIPESPYLLLVQVNPSPDAADLYIRDHAAPVDLVVTQDIPLASVLVPTGVAVISPRGEVYTPDNINERLSLRNLMHDLRDSGTMTGGPAQYGDRQKRAFAAAFDRELTRLLKR